MVDLYRKERRRKRLEKDKEQTPVRTRRPKPYKREKKQNGEYN